MRRVQGALCWLVFAALVWAVGTLTGVLPAGAQPIERGDERAGPPELGRVLWNRDCASCHGSDGGGTRWGPNIQDEGAAGVHLMVTTGRMPIEDLSDFAGNPPDVDRLQVDRGEVDYLPGQVAALTRYAASILDGPDVPVVDVADADAARGGALFRRNCATCHQWSGRGGVLTGGQVAPSLEASTPTQVVAAMRTGVGTMPQFDEQGFSDEQAADIAAYVDYLRHARNDGGMPLGFVGPVAEGAVAWLVGIVGLVLVVRWIGRATR